ncbi:MAG: tetratricopeptide repeat protein [Burkholderiaceae bacterium]|nr:tetratricopeptide repeat protein [Burkholderiaceae bacterium]
MAYDLQEQEQLEAIKAFWAKYGTAILAALTVALLIVAGTRGWAWYQARQSNAAAGVYAELVDAVQRRSIEQVKQRSEDILKEYGSTAYGPMAALTAARAYADAKDAAGAKGALQWVIDNADDAEYQQLARLRLAGLLLDEKDYDAALAVIAPGSVGKPGAEMAGAIADRRGDILFAKGDREAARAEYDNALSTLPANSALRQLVQLKLDAL